jgi:hypothetical protein
MKITQLLDEAKKGVKAPRHTVKPRNFVAKNAIATTSGAGAHKDKKKAEKQGDVKHKKQAVPVDEQTVAEEKQKGVDGKACWDGYKRMGTKKKGGKTVDNCVPMNESFDPEYDDEAGMADNNLETLKRAVEGLDDMINEGDNLPEWCQEKIAVAKSMLISVWDYMQSEENSLSEQYVGSGSSKDMQMAVDMAKMNARSQALAKIHGPNYKDVQMPDHKFGTVDLQSDGKGGYRASIPLNIKQAAQSNYLDTSPATSNTAPPNNYMDNQPAKSDGKQTGAIAPMESIRNPDLMSQTDYDRYQQGQMDQQKRDFKRDEMEQELGHEERGMYYVVIAKNGKWEHTKAQPRQEGMNAAQRVISALHAKYPSMHLGMVGPDGKVYNYGKGK